MGALTDLRTRVADEHERITALIHRTLPETMEHQRLRGKAIGLGIALRFVEDALLSEPAPTPPAPLTAMALWSSQETAAYLHVPARTLDEWAYKGLGPRFSRVGRHRRYRQADVERWLEAQTRGGAS